MADKNKNKSKKSYSKDERPDLYRNEELFRKYQGILTEAWLDEVAKQKGQDVADQIPALYQDVFTSNVGDEGNYRGLSRDPEQLNKLYNEQLAPMVGDISFSEDRIKEILGEEQFNEYKNLLDTGFLNTTGQMGTKEEFAESVPMFGGRTVFYPAKNPAQKAGNTIESVPNETFTKLLDQKGFGGWLKDHSKGVMGGLTAATGAALTATAVGAGVGVPMMVSGAGQIAGDVAQSNQKNEMEAQSEEALAAQEAQQKEAYFAQKEQEMLGNPQVPQMANGGFVPTNEYIGQSHKGPNGGIPVDAQGNPSITTGNQPVALTEDGETSYDNFIFSDKLKPEDSKKTFSDEAKKIKSKYKKRLGEDLDGIDPYARQSLEMELDELKTEQQEKAPPLPNGQGMPKFQGTRDTLPSQPPYIPQYGNEGNNMSGGVDLSGGMREADLAASALPNVDEIAANAAPTPPDQEFTPWKGGSMTPNLISAGVAAAGNVANLINAKNAGDTFRDNEVDAATYTPEDISLAKSREDDIARSADARREAMRTLRNTGSGNNYASMAVDMILSGNQDLSSRLIGSEVQEESMNTQSQNQANRFNAAQTSRADMFNSRQNRIADNLEHQQKSQAINNLFHIPQQVAQDYGRRNQAATTAASSFRDMIPVEDADGNLVYMPRTVLND